MDLTLDDLIMGESESQESSLKEEKVVEPTEEKKDEVILDTEDAVEKEEEVKEEDDKNIDTEDAPPDNITEKTSIASSISNFSKLLESQGVLSSFLKEDELGDNPVEALVNKVNESMDTRLQSMLDDLPEEKEALLIEKALSKFPEELRDLYKNYDSTLPISNLLNLRARQIDFKRLAAEDLTDNEDLQKGVLGHALALKGFSQEDIEEQLAIFEEKGLLESKASKMLPDIINHYKKEEDDLIEKNRKHIEKVEKDFENYLGGLKEVTPGKTLSKKEKDDILKSIKTRVKVADGVELDPVRAKIHKDPVKYLANLHILDKMGVLDLDWSKVNSKLQSNASKEFEKSLENIQFKSSPKKANLSSKDFDTFVKDLDIKDI